MKTYHRFLIFITLCIVLLFAIENSKEKPLDWNPYLTYDSKKPLGCYALHELLPSLVNNEVKVISEPFIGSAVLYGHEGLSTLFMINNQYNGDEYETAEVLDFVRRGNTVFLASSGFPMPFLDSLGIRTEIDWGADVIDSLKALKFKAGFPLKGDYKFKNFGYYSYFKIQDLENVEILGVDSRQQAVFIRKKMGEGYLYLHSTPDVFGNFSVMDSRLKNYVFACLSYLPAQAVLWDEYYKDYSRNTQTPLRVVLQSDSLRNAYYLLLFAVFLYIIFMGKRQQRAIPVVTPPANATLDFVKTVGRLYFQNGDHSGLAKKKINFLMDYLRSRLYMKTDVNKTDLAKMVSDKTGYSLAKLLEIFRYAERLEQGHKTTVTELSSLHSLLEDFYNHNK